MDVLLSFIDRLLAHPKDYRTLFRRYRNGVVHFQGSLLDSRFLELLKQGTECVSWVRALHNELVRFFSERLARLAVAQDQLSDLRDGIERIVYWYPYHEDPHIESLELTVVHAREALRRYQDDASGQRDELEQALKSGEAALQEGRRNWAKLRAHILREAGIE